jgi:hypothetical protein
MLDARDNSTCLNVLDPDSRQFSREVGILSGKLVASAREGRSCDVHRRAVQTVNLFGMGLDGNGITDLCDKPSVEACRHRHRTREEVGSMDTDKS